MAAPTLDPAPPTPAELRAWAVGAGLTVADRGRIKADVARAYLARGSEQR
ncbi:MAG: Lsr2 [Frankiales bacterium]|nr:Lsr2 [Frankiales bacterium]